jgi:hypothetical protein
MDIPKWHSATGYGDAEAQPMSPERERKKVAGVKRCEGEWFAHVFRALQLLRTLPAYSIYV